ncbi:hypothetical protein D3C76_1553770 [compost metagenome]
MTVGGDMDGRSSMGLLCLSVGGGLFLRIVMALSQALPNVEAGTPVSGTGLNYGQTPWPAHRLILLGGLGVSDYMR